MLCLPITKAALISTAAVCFLVTVKAEVFTLPAAVSLLGGGCSIGVWTTSCYFGGVKIDWSSTSAPFENYRDVYATETIQIAAIVSSGIAATWSVVVLAQSKSKPNVNQSWKYCGVVLHVAATVFGVLLPLAMLVWSETHAIQSEIYVIPIDAVVLATDVFAYGAGFFIAIGGSALLLVSSCLACAECCMVDEKSTVAYQPLRQVTYCAPGNAVDAIGSGAKTEHPYASIQQAE